MSEIDEAEIEGEITGDMEVILSPDRRYVELRATSNIAMDAGSFLSILALIVDQYGEDPDRFFAEYARELPRKNDLS